MIHLALLLALQVSTQLPQVQPPSVKHCHWHGKKPYKVRTCKVHKGESR